MKTEQQRVLRFRAWDGKKMIYPDRHKYVLRFDGTIGKFDEIIKVYHTEEWELMQFTGLHDKHGKEIYEGDIVRTHLGNVCMIQWGHVIEKSGMYDFEYTGFCFHHIKQNMNYHLDSTSSCEIIGNLHQDKTPT